MTVAGEDFTGVVAGASLAGGTGQGAGQAHGHGGGRDDGAPGRAQGVMPGGEPAGVAAGAGNGGGVARGPGKGDGLGQGAGLLAPVGRGVEGRGGSPDGLLEPGVPDVPGVAGDGKAQWVVPGEDGSAEDWQGFYRLLGVPENAEDYVIEGADDLGGMNATVNARLHEAGFTPRQAQLVYDLAGEILRPMAAELETGAKTAALQARLAAEFGGEAQWAKLAPSLASWGQKNLPDAYEAMAQSPEGVRALYRLMSEAGEPGLAATGAGQMREAPEVEIDRLMNDPRYWRDRNPVIIAQVQAAFDRLHRNE
ncbi:capsid assembly protein [Thalassospira marina]|uniref:Uncharacterized protein n=1 Tax=Thalassospira marina TaxID=2048283 RepID=A0ABM6Q6H1_9PROT|nr:hypothetical protein [Thalassospira marina]AUG52114.1 hypothetical protein CSC3H3_04775 [Thalassospira marina]